MTKEILTKELNKIVEKVTHNHSMKYEEYKRLVARARVINKSLDKIRTEENV